jgi:ABC-type multidrug transport system ATPase subunit
MSLVQGLARDGRTVVATIHSPSAYAFSLFDAVLMLARGRTVYFGPQGEWRP